MGRTRLTASGGLIRRKVFRVVKPCSDESTPTTGPGSARSGRKKLSDRVQNGYCRMPNGETRESIGEPAFTATGELIEIVVTQIDVTERKRAEEEHERLRQLKSDLART